MTSTDERTPEEFFDGCPDGLALYVAVAGSIAGIGEAEVRGWLREAHECAGQTS